MRYGYARSIQEESLRAQVELLKRKNLDVIIEDQTGEKLSELIDSLKSGDSLYVISLDRISRRTSLFVKIAERLLNNGIKLYIGERLIGLYDVYAFGAIGEQCKEDTKNILEHHKAWKEKQKESYILVDDLSKPIDPELVPKLKKHFEQIKKETE